MPREQIPITPEVLRWARKRAGFSVEEIRDKFRDIEAWEKGVAFPTYPQLERLAEAFKVPVAIFFFPKPPDIPPIQESFRTLPAAQFETLPRALLLLLRKAKALQINLSELHEGKNPVERFIVRDLRFASKMNIPDMARQVRDYLGISLETQMNWANSTAAFDAWRAALEAHGVAVFKDAFRDNMYSGFCLYDDVFPLIYVNNSVKTRQIFTLFHELAHLLFRTSGIDKFRGESGEGLLFSAPQVEIICNRFAAEFLLPASNFKSDMCDRPATEETAEWIARRYHVSREFVYRRFLDRNNITREEYLAAAERWIQQGQSGRGGNYYLTKISYLGVNYVKLAFSRYRQERISEFELADYLDTKVRNLAGIEDYFMKKVV